MKDLLTSLRASNETYHSMKHSARAIIRRAEIPLLAVIVLYKAATNLLFVPLMQQLWSLTLRFAPMHYLNNNNASDIFSSPAIIHGNPHSCERAGSILDMVSGDRRRRGETI